MKKTVVELDLVGYSTICDTLEQGLDVKSSAELNQQIQSFVDAGLNAVNAIREQHVMQTTGDGAIVVFDTADDAHRFAQAVNDATREHNQHRTQPLAKRIFRSGAATGEIDMQPKRGGGFDIAGMTIARAVRLEAKAQPGGFLVDEATFQSLAEDQRKRYASKERIAGKPTKSSKSMLVN
jgi:class 3 adenylate cyclase